MTLVLRYAARSDRGLIRGNNQDSVYAGPRLLAVADGMGGHAAGDIASKVVIAALEHLDDDTPTGDMLQSLRSAVHEGSEHLREVIRESPQLEGMGTTLTAILFAGGRLALCHVGDSRAYLLRDGQFTQITHDDTFVQTLIDDGRITPEEANHHPQRSLLLRALNGQEVEPDLSMREARAGDRYLLCSDGLSGVVSEETLAEALQNPDPEATADRLVELALRSGGPDNITVIVADVLEDTGSNGRFDPVVDGAAGDNVGQREVDPRSAAGRAALADQAAAPPPTPTLPTGGGPSARRRPVRILLVAGALLTVLVAGAIGMYFWALNNWFVGVNGSGDDRQVAVFRGLDVSFLGMDLHRLDRGTDLALADLTPAARNRVLGSITADDSADAERIVSALADQRLPICRTTTGATGATTPTGTPTPPAASPTTAQEPAPGDAALPEAPALEDEVAAPTSARTTSAPVPGVDCREVD
ncbi:serine/threonine-protein phosphatase [Blastococcus sp. MG754426]|uniref:PP2C family protein-serine/threonine phosphatase n=1 Tax=unclassified Blastococcus TaxID=2619396 RepID=UPI001EF15894|nr:MULTISPECIES: PP2C family serine/threonine-protein phosphatase [unclassified Blastococcus]MCF6508159.1 serine/threonine-protein phosphatase [Blastococcus sp. MG754426]MCF6512232.1 serine/threonine-protein phosphatase [Blastococcus sp. MG754427]